MSVFEAGVFGLDPPWSCKCFIFFSKTDVILSHWDFQYCFVIIFLMIYIYDTFLLVGAG